MHKFPDEYKAYNPTPIMADLLAGETQVSRDEYLAASYIAPCWFSELSEEIRDALYPRTDSAYDPRNN
jgi:hypothetical protein